MDFDEIMNADRLRKQEANRQAALAAKARQEAEAAAAMRKKAHQAILGPLLKAMRARWEKKFRGFPEYRCIGQTSPATGAQKGIRWVRISIAPAKGGSASQAFDLHASADLDTGTIQVLGYSERYPTATIESRVEAAELSQEKMDEILARFAEWFTSLGRKG